MRIIQIDAKGNSFKVVPEVNDDLWHLHRVIEKGDLVSGATDRKIKAREEGERHRRVKLFLTVEVEKIEFHRGMGSLRVTGPIREGKPAELVELGASHSIEIGLGKPVKVKKKVLHGFQVERLKRASNATKLDKVLLVVLDEEQASFAFLKEFELEQCGSIRSGRSGKMFESSSVKGGYFSRVIERVKELKADKVVFAGPGFTKDELRHWLEEKRERGVFYFTSTNSVGLTGLHELVKGKAIEGIVREMQLVKETRLVEELLKELGRDSGLGEYGFESVKRAVEAGAVKELLVCDSILLNQGEAIEHLIALVERTRGKVHLIDSGGNAGKKLLSLSGIAALLRFKVRA